MKKIKFGVDSKLTVAALFLAFLCIVSVISAVFFGKPAVITVSNIPIGDGDKEGYYTFLIAGTDAVSNSTDVLMLASLDIANEKINILQIPRDTFIDHEAAGYSNVSRINAIYAAEYNRAVLNGKSDSNAKKEAMEKFKAILEDAFCITIDEYILIDISAFRTIVDAVGGVDFDVPYDMVYSDPYQDLYIDLKAGYQHLNGAGAEQLIRYRSTPSADIGRISIRESFMKAMAAQIKENLTFSTVVTIVTEVISKTTTSAGLFDAIKYARGAYSSPLENINIKTITAQSVPLPGGGWSSALYINKRAVMREIDEYIDKSKGEISIDDFDKNGIFSDESDQSAILYYEREDL